MAAQLIIVYARVSTEDQARSGYSLGEQLRACRALAEQLAAAAGAPASIVEFTDDMSGELLERPGLQAALELVRTQKASHFVCLDPDRLARRMVLLLLVTDQIESAGCQLEFVQHDYQETAEGKFFYQLRGAVAEFEKAKILERTARGARGKARDGGLPHLVRLFGYDFVKGAGKVKATEVLVPSPTEADWVRAIVHWCADEGLGPLAIANRLNELGVPTKVRGAWQHGQVRRILRHEVYTTGRLALGKRDHKGIAVARRLPEEDRRRKGISLTARPKAPEHWQYVQVEPIVPADLWHRAQEVLAGFRVGARAENHRDRVRMLTGLGRCGVCGSPLYYLNGRKIVCSGRYEHHWKPGVTPSDCTLPAKQHVAVEAAVWAEVKSWFQDRDKLHRVAEEASREQAPPAVDARCLQAEAGALEAQLAAKREEQERVGLLFARGLWPADKALPQLEQIGTELKALEARLGALRRQIGVTPAPVVDNPLLRLLANPAWFEQTAATLDDLDEIRRLELVRLVVGRYVLQPSGRGEAPLVRVYPRLV